MTVLAEDFFGDAAMNALAVPKSPMQNRLEGFALTAIFQGFPTFATAALLLKLAHHQIAGGVMFFVVATSILHGLRTPWLAPKFPKFFKNSCEPLFFDARLSFAEKLSQWRAQPIVSLQLVTNVMMLSVLAVGVASRGDASRLRWTSGSPSKRGAGPSRTFCYVQNGSHMVCFPFGPGTDFVRDVGSSAKKKIDGRML
jgi:hypothetical protein